MNSTIHCLDPNPGGKHSILLLHGLGATSYSWTFQFSAFADHNIRPIAPDIPGFGSSAYDGNGWNLSRVVSLLKELLDEMNVSPVHILGLSMGGVVAQQFAHEFPHLTRKLILASTFSVLRPKSINSWFYFLRRALAVQLLGLDAQAPIVARRIFPNEDQAIQRAFLEATIRSSDKRAYRAAMRSLGSFDSRAWLSKIKSNTMIITGERDTTVPMSQQELLVELIPQARHVVIKNAGHAINIDQQEIFNKTVIDFLKE